MTGLRPFPVLVRSVESGEVQLQRESLANRITREMSSIDERSLLSDEQAEAASRILRPVLEDLQTEVSTSGVRRLHAI